ncbi:hypothetical protein [Aeromicrobium sp. 179-A 4D2 NHS]|uniref:hypothetical protein n=1 Tax=Aeromicrobium sp. 179-A 4D2 NHS TaxID=3142375 RepID=UPI0039A12C8F
MRWEIVAARLVLQQCRDALADIEKDLRARPAVANVVLQYVQAAEKALANINADDVDTLPVFSTVVLSAVRDEFDALGASTDAERIIVECIEIEFDTLLAATPTVEQVRECAEALYRLEWEADLYVLPVVTATAVLYESRAARLLMSDWYWKVRSNG